MFRNIFKSKHRIFGLEISDWWFVIAGLAVFAALSLVTITKFSFWFDESFGAYLIKYNFVDIIRYTATDVHPPLFYWVLKLWAMLFGNTELALRSMSVLFGGIAIVLGYVLANKLFNKTAARISLIFMVLSPMFIRYSQEARMYTMVAAIAFAATLVLIYALESKSKKLWVLYGVLVGLGLWIHYFAAIVWIAHWVWRADSVRRTARKGEFIKKFFDKNWRLAHYVAIAVFLPWLPLFVGQSLVVQIAGFWIPAVTPGTPLNFLTNVVYYRDLGETIGWLTLGFVVALLLVTVLAVKVYRKSLNRAEKSSYRLIMALAFVPAITLFFISMPARSVFVDRYLIPSTLGIAIFIGVTLAYGYKYMRIRWRYAITVFIGVLMIIGIVNVYWLGNFNKNSHESNQTRQIVREASIRADDGQPIIAATPWLFYEVVFYETDTHPVYYLNIADYKYGSLDMLKYSSAHKISDVNEFAKQHPKVWYVGWIGQGDLKTPYSNWRKIQEVTINDPIKNTPQYKAIEFQIK